MINTKEYLQLDEKERDKMRHKFISKAHKIYQKIVDPKMNETDKGKFVIVEPDTKSYFVGQTSTEALEQAKQKFPDKMFYLARVGFKSAYSFGGLRVKHKG